MATIYIDDRPHQVDPGKNLLQVALTLGYDLPYFCWHPALGSVGACRQCAVRQYRDENDKTGMIAMACMVPVAEDLRVSIEDAEAVEFRKSVIEWLMTNHPHDCPVCDEGGECHLQDMTVMTGHAYRRFRFRKRTFENQYLGPFINHEMNRCIECYRCVRFYKDYAGGSDLDVFGAHNHVYFGRREDGVLESAFSGNLVEVCPTGVFTDKTLKLHYSRKWDLQSAPSVCVHCGLGCNTLAATRYGGVRRILNRYHSEVNGYFLCDRGRFGYEFTHHAKRIRTPVTNRAGGHGDDTPVRTPEEATALLRDLLAGGHSVIGIGSPRASLESNFALRDLVGAENFFSGVSEGECRLLSTILDILRKSPVHSPSLAEIEQSDAVLILGEDILNTAPRMALSVRQALRHEAYATSEGLGIPPWHDKAVRDAAQEARSPMLVAASIPTGLDREARMLHRAAPDDIARLARAIASAIDSAAATVGTVPEDERAFVETAAGALRGAKRPLVISGTSAGSLSLVEAAANVAWALHRAGGDTAAVSFVVPECNSMGAALLGGRNLAEAFDRAAKGEIDTAIILENDLYRRAPPAQVDSFLASVANTVVLDALEGRTTAEATLILPAAVFAEGDGTLVNNEGRAQRYFQALDPDPVIREAWRWLDGARPDGPRWRSLDGVIATLEDAIPHLKGVAATAPPSHRREGGQKLPRSPRRFSGRTAMHADADVHEPRPPNDVDSPLAFSMEGFPSQPPPALVTHYWAPGWNSVQALNKFQSEVGGPLRGGDPGISVIESVDAGDYFEEPSATGRDDPKSGELLIVPAHAIFGSEELSARAAAVASRIPDPSLVLHPGDAAARKLEAGCEATLQIGDIEVSLQLATDERMPPGVGAYPVGRDDLPFLELPLPGTVK